MGALADFPENLRGMSPVQILAIQPTISASGGVSRGLRRDAWSHQGNLYVRESDG